MAFDFPASPTNGQTVVVNGVTFSYSTAKTAWSKVGASGNFVPKDSALSTGAALVPTGLNAERPAAPTDGMVRFNTDPSSTLGDRLEVYESGLAKWLPLEYAIPVAVLPDYTVTNGEVLTGLIECANFIVPAGVTATVNFAVVVKCTGGATIDGTLSGNQLGTLGAAPYSLVPYNNTYGGPGFGLGGGSAGDGGRPYPPQASIVGSGGASGFIGGNGASAASTGTGGASGATVAIRAVDPIVVTGTISMNGGQGTIVDRTHPLVQSGPGGGSGGGVFLVSDGDVTNSGTINANGGNGESCHNGGYGGGGGGGGYVVLQSNFGTATLGTINVNGGADGFSLSSAIGSGGGGAFGGAGGDGGKAAGPPTAGSTGIASTSGAPLF